MTGTSFDIHAPQDSPAGQRAMLALAPRGAAFRWHAAIQSRLVIAGPGGEAEIVEDPLSMIERIEAHHPDQPLHPRDEERRARHRALMVAAMAAERRLDAVLSAGGTGQLDLALHFLFRSLEAIEAGIEPPPRTDRQPLSNLDVTLAPLLWRIVLLDRTAATFVLAPLPRLAARARWLMRQIEVNELFDAAAIGRFVAGLRVLTSAEGAAADEDWSRALGPAGRDPGRGSTVRGVGG